ncbi:MAG: hypothetical protein EAZ92_12180 [Candidatus Kapaibacterium sp.]|nr:MAG: hypothetical protein EAZ92_12180 [Candidatus Kapabacteria bacterium]
MVRPCAPDEIIVRAIHTEHYDATTGILRPKVFEGRDVSVSRLQILTIEELFPIFTADIDAPPERIIIQVGSITVQELASLANAYKNPETKQSAKLNVIQDPCPVQKEYKQHPTSSFEGVCICPYNSNQEHCPEHSSKANAPCPRNYAHAEIRGDKISKGLANVIVKYLEEDGKNRLYTYPERQESVPMKPSL